MSLYGAHISRDISLVEPPCVGKVLTSFRGPVLHLILCSDPSED